MQRSCTIYSKNISKQTSRDYCDVFISCLDSHSDGTHSLQRIHWWASDAMLNLFKSVPLKKQTQIETFWSKVSANVFWVNYSFNISFLNNEWQAKRKGDKRIDWCTTGLLVTLWAIDRLGRRKTMALCFFVFSLCIVPLYGCVGRSESTSITVMFLGAFKPVVITFVNVLWITTFPILQDFFDSIYIHCEGFYRWRFPGSICVHPWGENSFSIHFSWYIIMFWKNSGSKGSSILLCPVSM